MEISKILLSLALITCSCEGFGFLYHQRTYFSKTRADTFGVVVFVPRFWRFDTPRENQTQEDLTVEPVQSPPTVSAAGVTQPFDQNGNAESKETSFSKGSPPDNTDFESEHLRQDEIQESSTPEASIDQSIVNVMTTSNTRTLNAPQTNKPVIQVGSPTEVIDKGGLYTINDHDMSLNPDDVEVITLEQHRGGGSEIKAFFVGAALSAGIFCTLALLWRGSKGKADGSVKKWTDSTLKI